MNIVEFAKVCGFTVANEERQELDTPFGTIWPLYGLANRTFDQWVEACGFTYGGVRGDAVQLIHLATGGVTYISRPSNDADLLTEYPFEKRLRKRSYRLEGLPTFFRGMEIRRYSLVLEAPNYEDDSYEPATRYLIVEYKDGEPVTLYRNDSELLRVLQRRK